MSDFREYLMNLIRQVIREMLIDDLKPVKVRKRRYRKRALKALRGSRKPSE